jgi:GAF domain-containing protein
VNVVARLIGTGKCSLWLEDRQTGDFVCAASVGYDEDPEAAPILQMRVPKLVAETLIERHHEPVVLTSAEAKETFFGQSPAIVFRPLAVVALHSGYGVRGWISVRAADDDTSHFTDERLRLLEGLAFRASMALEKALLYHDQRESAHVANALLEFGRELAEASDEAEALDRAAEVVARMLESPGVFVLLQDQQSGDVRVTAARGRDEWAGSVTFPDRLVAQTLQRGEEAFVLPADEVGAAFAAHGVKTGRHAPLAVAPLRLPGGRLGCIVSVVPDPELAFSDVTLRLLAGMARQAALLIAR